jgi:hypothetical protein
LMQCMGDGDALDPASLLLAFQIYRRAVEPLPPSELPLHAYERDARATGLSDAEVDVVLTSPPYINVFNYHQNYRKVMELLGYLPLEAAHSEIGANRKHRGNRFFTVVQYCLDMLGALVEMHRVLAPGGVAVIVIGRESTVRGRSFPNGSALFALAMGTGAFGLTRRHERVFVSRYGTRVFEEVLVLRAQPQAPQAHASLARSVGALLLENALSGAPADVRYDLEAALEQTSRIAASPLRVLNSTRAQRSLATRGRNATATAPG